MALFLHLLTRLVLVIIGYLVALLAGLVSIVAIYGILSSLPDAPRYFGWVSATPLLALLVPGIAIVVVFVALAVTAIPMLAVAAITEIFALRYIWLHMIFGALIGVGGAGVLVPMTDDGTWPSSAADLAIIAVAGAIGGLFYWLIAGRHAGLRPRPAPLAYQPPADPSRQVTG